MSPSLAFEAGTDAAMSAELMVVDEWLPLGLERHPEVVALRNPFKRRLQLMESRSLDGASAQVDRRAGQAGQVHPWAEDLHYHYVQVIGGLELQARIGYSAADFAPNHGGRVNTDAKTFADRSGLPMRHTVLLGYDGEAEGWQCGHPWRLRCGDCLVLPGQLVTSSLSSLSVDNLGRLAGLYSIVLLHLDAERLLQAIKVMGAAAPVSRVEHLLQRSTCLSLPTDPRQSCLLVMLRQLIDQVDALLDLSPILLERLQLDDQIYRLMAALMVPKLTQQSAYDRLCCREREGRDAFDELIDYIKANLDQPLNLTVLESRSHYSRRALQYAFRERLGCTATQWIRQQRLDLARQLLEHPRVGDTVASIAVASGYRSLSLFSVDFQQRFHLKPSDLLREARASSRSPGG